MGLKDAAKKLMAEAGVPVTPGYMGEDQSPERLAREAEAIGFPVLIKAVAGGGGKGMRKVDASADFADALDSCRREAASSFGNDVVLLEKWIESPRHIEVQVFGDTHGQVVHLFERDCSLQRRHQKVIEEAPAPGMDEATRAAVCGAAVRAAQAVNYEGAGTIEFIADGSEGLRADRIWFMEMNTRLQVEHPVTEEITGQDLVEWQLRVASGERLPKRQDELAIAGHAIEARLYAEDPSTGFLPSTGRLEHFDLGEDGRIETGVEEGDPISPFYDPMIAKLIASGADRGEAIDTLAAMLDGVEIWPVRTNAGFLCNCLLDEDFEAARLDTGFIARRLEALVPDDEPDEALWRSAAVVALAADEQPLLSGFRLNSAAAPAATLAFGNDRRRIVLNDDDDYAPASGFADDERVVLFEGGQAYAFDKRVRGGAGSVGNGSLLAPMPGRVISVDVAAGERVEKGQRLLTLEAMKMEHAMLAPFNGVVAELTVSAGAQVQVEALLVRVEAAEA
jgi:3-methylcrotonyl-CoA carboxylase alpha subunit